MANQTPIQTRKAPLSSLLAMTVLCCLIFGAGIFAQSCQYPCIPVISGPTSLPDGVETQTYSPTTFTVSNGTGPYTWTLSGGVSGMVLVGNDTTADIQGTIADLTANSDLSPKLYSNIVLQVSDSSLGVATSSVTLSMSVYSNVEMITPSPLPPGTASESYTPFQFQAQGGVAEYIFAMTGDPIPSGMSFDPATGILSGTPDGSAASTTPYNLSIQVTDSSPTALTMDSVSTSLIISGAALVVLTTSFPTVEIGITYPTLALAATGGIPPYSWTASGLTVPGLILSQNQISGTAGPESEGTYVVTIAVTDSSVPALTDNRTVVFNVVEMGAAPLTITNTSLLVGIEGQPYPATQLIATGGTPTYDWSASMGLAPGLALSTVGASTILAGTPSPNSAGSYLLKLQVSDSSDPTQATNVFLTLVIAPALSSSSSDEDSPEEIRSALVAGAAGCSIQYSRNDGIWVFLIALAMLACAARNLRDARD